MQTTQEDNLKTAQKIYFELKPIDNKQLANLCGPFNKNLLQLEIFFSVTIKSRSNQFEVIGKGETLKKVKNAIETLYNVAKNKKLLPATIQLYLNDNDIAMDHSIEKNKITVKNRHGKITGRGKNQQDYLQKINTHDLTLGVGPAGTGKTYLAVACAVESLENDLVDRLVLVRPAVEAGERLGFLPGDLAQKIDPYLRPIYDALFEMLGQQKVAKYIEQNIIEIAPLAYMRGRTLNDAFIILDEAQNTTTDQMKMFLTRIGFGSKCVVTGDITQVDLPHDKTSGLRHALKILKNIKGVGVTYFEKKDIVRHPLVKEIVTAYEQDETK